MNQIPPLEEPHSTQEPTAEGRWSLEEHHHFLQAIFAHGKNWTLIERVVQGRNNAQVRSHAQKFFLKIKKIQKERKRNAKKGLKEKSSNEMQFLRTISQYSPTSNTPPELLKFLKIDLPSSPPSSGNEMSRQHKSRGQRILQEVLACQEQESFLISLIRRSAGVLDLGIAEMIDFPLANEEESEESDQMSPKRKRSFSLYDEENDETKYQRTVMKLTRKGDMAELHYF